ncbi:MAG: polysaccharide deacetylase family protein [Myxococcota bacterium]|nr:polysaccharide deacetylase family protein [Myxococcota bacterium]
MGSLCISIDLELAWGIWDKPDADYHGRCAEREVTIVRRLAELFDTYEVSATWAIVGRLLERDDAAAQTTEHGERIWYAPDLIEIIRGTRVEQDVGSHSYAHLYFGEATREQLREDLAAARRVHAQHGLPFTSFVFPRNQIAHLDLLRDAGVRVFRSVDQGWHIAVRDRLGRRAGRLANLLDKVVPIPPAVVQPIDHGGLVELPSSMLLLARKGLRRAVHPAMVVAKARQGLAAARRADGVFHLWFHPSNFYYDTEGQLATLEQILRAATALRERGELGIEPMCRYAAA